MKCPACGTGPMTVRIDAVYPSPIGADALIVATLMCDSCSRKWKGQVKDATFNETLGAVQGGQFVADPFRCPVCNMVSHHPMDMAEGYCGNCHDWTRD